MQDLTKKEEWLSGKRFHPDSSLALVEVNCGLWILLPSRVGVVSTSSHSLGNLRDSRYTFQTSWTGVSRWLSSPRLAPRRLMHEEPPTILQSAMWWPKTPVSKIVLMARRLFLSAPMTSFHGRKSVSPWEPTEWTPMTTMIGTELGKSYILVLQPLK